LTDGDDSVGDCGIVTVVESRFSGVACQDLRLIEDAGVRAELLYIASSELEVPEATSPIEGRLRDHPGLYWRRGVRREDLDDFEGWDTDDDADDDTWQPFNFILIYRLVTTDEVIDHQIVVSTDATAGRALFIRRATRALLVVKIWDNTVVARHLSELG
jgi:hypothetical protein